MPSEQTFHLFEYEAASELFANAFDNAEPQLKLVRSKRDWGQGDVGRV